MTNNQNKFCFVLSSFSSLIDQVVGSRYILDKLKYKLRQEFIIYEKMIPVGLHAVKGSKIHYNNNNK